MVTLNVPMMSAPEIHLSKVDALLDANGALKDDGVRQLLTQFMESFACWVARFTGK